MEVQKNASEPITQRTWFKFGLYGGAAAIAITVILYVIDELLLFNPLYGYLPILILLVTGVWAAVAEKQRFNGYIAYSKAVVTSLGAFVVGTLLLNIFNSILFFAVDTDLLKKGMDLQMAQMDKMLEKGDISEERYDAAVEQISNMGDNMFIFQMLIGLIFLVIMGLIVFLISSAIIRKEGGPAHHTI